MARAEPRRQGPALEQVLAGQAGLLDVLPDPVFAWSGGEGIVSWNVAAGELYGYTREQAMGRVSHDLLETRFPDGLTWEDVEAVLAERGAWSGELIHTTADGRRVVVDARLRVIHRGRGPGLGGSVVLEVNRDASDSVRAESRAHARARQQEALAALGSAALTLEDYGALMADAAGRIADVMAVELVRVLELSADGRCLVMRGGAGWDAEGGDVDLPGDGTSSPGGFALLVGEPVVMPDLAGERRFAVPEVLRRHGATSGVSLPIPGQPRPCGVLSVYSKAAREFTPDEVHFLRAVANVLGAAIREHRAGEALRESEERFRGIFEQAAVGIAQVGLDGRWLRFNSALCRIIGYPPEELAALRIHDVVHPDDLPADLAHVGRLLSGQADSYSMDKRYVRGDGSVSWVTVARSVVRDAAGTPLYFVSVIEDVTERRHAEQAVRDSEGRMRAVVDTAVDAIITIDERGIMESANPAACRMFGYDAAELIGRNVSMLMPQPYRREHDEYVNRYLRTGEKRIIGIGREVVGLRRDGSTFPLDLAVSEFAVNGRRMFTGLIRDLTERRRLERQILDAGAEEQRRIGHDLHDGLCQQLTGCAFALEVLGQKLERRSSPETASIRKVSELVDQAITQARTLAHGLQPVTLEATGLATALRELAGKAESMFRVSCLFVGEAEVEVHDNTVATHLYRIAQEAISNAVKHGRAKTVIVDLGETARELRLTVTDDGVGIGRAAPSARGTGIGLQTMRYRARAIGGALDVRPGERGGTVVTCVVPQHGGGGSDGDGREGEPAGREQEETGDVGEA
jgi:PAS domain S-box-containing protein